MFTNRSNAICLLHILSEYSDSEHILSMRDIIGLFHSEFGMVIDRRTVYCAIDTLEKLNYDICGFDETRKGYYLRSRIFETAEIRLLMDAVYSMHSIPPKQTADLIEKLQHILSVHERVNYKHLAVVRPERKTENRSVFYNIELLDEAITKKQRVSFIYMCYGFDKKLYPRRNERYEVSPYGMVCDNQNYYLICIKSGKTNISYYRIDLINAIEILDEPLELPPSKVDLSTTKKIVYAFAGKPEEIILRCDDEIIGGFIDKFGTEPKITPLKSGRFEARLTAVPQGVLYWTLQYMPHVEIVSPQSMRDEAINIIRSNKYGV